MENVELLHPLTATQKGLLYQTLLGDTDSVYRTQSQFDIVSPLDVKCLKRSIEYLVSRHAMLRGMFLHVGLDEPAIVIKTVVELPWQEIDLTGLSAEQQLPELDRLASEALSMPFQLDCAPLMKFTVAILGNDVTHIILDVHHLIFDGWSSVLFFGELQIVYSALKEGVEPTLVKAGSFARHVQRVNGLDTAEAEAIWRRKLAGFTHPTPLPRQTSPGKGLFATGNFNDYIEADITRELENVARQERVTLNTLVQAAWALVLARYADTEDVLFGVTVNGRSLTMQEHERTFGLFSNTLPLRVRCEGKTPLSDWYRHVQAELATLVQYESTSLADVHRCSDIKSGIELFESLLVFQSFPDVESAETPALHIANARVHENSPLPLTIEVFHGHTLGFLVMFMEEQFEENTLQDVISHFKHVLLEMSMAGTDSKIVSDLQMLRVEEQHTLLENTKSPILYSATEQAFHNLYEAYAYNAERHANQLAAQGLHANGQVQSLTYGELTEQALRVASVLSAVGVGQSHCVAICVRRSVSMLPLILGVMKTGAYWLPMDNTYPLDRLTHMLDDSGASLLLTDGDTPAGLLSLVSVSSSERPTRHLSTLSVQQLLGDESVEEITQFCDYRSASLSTEALAVGSDVAYLVYTSGSTGTPKAILGSHKATLNRLDWGWHEMPYLDNEVCVQKTALSFVDSIAEILSPLLKGVPLHIVTDETVRNPLNFVEELERIGVTRLLLVPSLLGVLLEVHPDLQQRLASLRICCVSGEALAEPVARSFLDKFESCSLYNLYGSSEVSADVTYDKVSIDSLSTPMPIGKPTAGNQVLLLDSHQQLSPPGAIGEIAVAGIGLSAGYHNADSLNDAHFIVHPAVGDRVYLTGDLARLDVQGRLIPLGRRDKQFKIRGQRVEAADIEKSMLAHHGVARAVVSLHMGEQLLGYYVSADDTTVDPEEMLETLRKSLPPYMIPWQLAQLAEIPTLPNGKTDYQALPLPIQSTLSRAQQHVAPRTETEKRVAEAWLEVLGGDSPSITANFVASGGTSLTGMRFNARLYREFEKMIMPRMLLSASLAQLALEINPDDKPAAEGVRVQQARMSPAYIGKSASPLFSIMHEPEGELQTEAVLICPTVGADYMRSHRTLQMTAVELARQGYPVLRFDLFGTGDSSGSSDEASFERWQDDINTAADYLRGSSGCQTLHVVSLRLGVPLMLSAGINNVNKMVLWDPEWTGDAFIRRQKVLHLRALKDLDRYRFRQRRSISSEMFGYTWSSGLLADLNQLDSSPFSHNAARQISVIKTGFRASTDRHAELLRQKVERLEIRLLPNVDAWTNYHEAGNILLANPVVQEIKNMVIS